MASPDDTAAVSIAHDHSAVRARELADTAAALESQIRALLADLRAAPDESVRRLAFRLDEAAGRARSIGTDLRETAADLARVAAASAPGNCTIPWGVCPDHGNTLTSSGGTSWCRRPDCVRQWTYDRGGLPCAEPAAYVWTAPDGTAAVCAGHAIPIRRDLGRQARLAPIKPGIGG